MPHVPPRPSQPPGRRRGAGPAPRRGPPPAPRRDAAPAPRRGPAAVPRQIATTAERRVIASLLVALGVAIALLALIGVRASVERQDARVRADRAFARTGLAQLEFHARRGRFAFWPELEAQGVRPPPAFTVVHSNATASHWYLRLRDSVTGMLCDRLGQPMEPAGATTGLTCRAP